MALTYDPLASNPANYIVDEAQVVNTDAAVYPVEHPFYILDFQIWGTAVEDSIEVELRYNLEYSLSAPFTSRINVTGKDVHSYIVLLKPELWSDVRITYRGVGGDLDIDLNDEIIAAAGFDRTDPSTWLDFHGEIVAKLPAVNSSDTPDKSVTERMALMTDKVIDQLERPQFLLSDPASILARDSGILTDEKAGLALEKSLLALEIVLPPIINTPLDGSVGYSDTDEVTTDNMATSDHYHGEHTSGDWEMYSDSGLTNLVDSSYNDTDNPVSWKPRGLTPTTYFYVRCRHRSDGHISEWSNVVSFITTHTLAFISTPTITSPINESIDISVAPVLQSSAFIGNSTADTHATTDWQISDVADFSNIVYQAINSEDLVSHTVSYRLDPLTVYYVRCRHKTASLISNYSIPISFTTVEIEASIKLIGGASGDVFNNIIIDPVTGNYICVGYAFSEGGTSGSNCFIAVFDSKLVLVDSLLIGNNSHNYYYGIIKDPNTGNYICAGKTNHTSSGDIPTIIVVDPSLSATTARLFNTSRWVDNFNDIIIDPNTGNYVCIGFTEVYDSTKISASIFTINGSLNMVNYKLLTANKSDKFRAVIIDPNTGNYVCVGRIQLSTDYYGAYIAIFDTNLNLINDKLISGYTQTEFNDITFDLSTGNYVCVGYHVHSTNDDAFIAIFDTNLNLMSNKSISKINTTDEVFNGIAFDPDTNNYICVGKSSTDAYIAVFDVNLNLINDKAIGGTGVDIFTSVIVDPNTGNYVCAGFSTSAGAGNNDAMVVTFLTGLDIVDTIVPNIPSFIVSSPDFTENNNPYLVIRTDVIVAKTLSFTEFDLPFSINSPPFTETFSLL